jgi:hypothetical protein
MVTAQLGALTSQNAGDGTTATIANRVLVDFKDALIDYKVTDLDAIGMFCEPMTTDTGGDIDLTIAKPSMVLEEIEEGDTPAYQHTLLRNERINVKEWGLAIAVTRRMIEDSRFNEVELALNEARRAVSRHVTQHIMSSLMGVYHATYGTGYGGADITTATEANIAQFSNVPEGAFFGTTPGTPPTGVESRLVDYGDYSASDLNTLGPHYIASASAVAGASDIALDDLTQAMELMGAKGMTADTVLVSPSHVKNLLNMADFTLAFSANQLAGPDSPAKWLEGARNQGVIGNLFGLKVVSSSWCPQGRYGVFDTAVKPMVYVERRGLTVEEANPGFGILGSYFSMRYGLKIVRPEAGVIVYGA